MLSSLTVPGHEQVVDALKAAGLATLVCDPQSLHDVYADIHRIATALGVPDRGTALVASMQAAMPLVEPASARPRVLVEWWPKPVIAAARYSWVNDIIWRAGGMNPWGEVDAKSVPLEYADAAAEKPDVVVMSWCGVKVENYRADKVRGRAGWDEVPAVANDRIHAISDGVSRATRSAPCRGLSAIAQRHRRCQRMDHERETVGAHPVRDGSPARDERPSRITCAPTPGFTAMPSIGQRLPRHCPQ